MSATQKILEKWLQDDYLQLIEGLARDGYTYKDVANRMGVNCQTLYKWVKKYPELENALNQGREIVDYKVENALLKSALGYKTKECKITSIINNGVLVETQKETVTRDVAPNVTAIQVWLYNRLPDKWKKNRDGAGALLSDEDNRIQITVTRATETDQQKELKGEKPDERVEDELNNFVEVRPLTEDEKEEKKEKKSGKKNKKKEEKASEIDLDYWPDDWENL